VFPASAPLEGYQQRARELAAEVVAVGVPLAAWYAFPLELREAAAKIAGDSWITFSVGLEFGAWQMCQKHGQAAPVPDQETVAEYFGFARSGMSPRIAALVKAGILDDPYA
jgi:hypothetical protein